MILSLSAAENKTLNLSLHHDFSLQLQLGKKRISLWEHIGKVTSNNSKNACIGNASDTIASHGFNLECSCQWWAQALSIPAPDFPQLPHHSCLDNNVEQGETLRFYINSHFSYFKRENKHILATGWPWEESKNNLLKYVTCLGLEAQFDSHAIKKN